MDAEEPERLLLDEKIRLAIWRKQRISLVFSLVLALLFFGLVLVIGFAPSLLSPKLPGGVITVYIVVSAFLLIIVCALMNLFVAIKLRDSHEDIRELIKSGRR